MVGSLKPYSSQWVPLSLATQSLKAPLSREDPPSSDDTGERILSPCHLQITIHQKERNLFSICQMITHIRHYTIPLSISDF